MFVTSRRMNVSSTIYLKFHNSFPSYLGDTSLCKLTIFSISIILRTSFQSVPMYILNLTLFLSFSYLLNFIYLEMGDVSVLKALVAEVTIMKTRVEILRTEFK